jgi:hypothetical protein
MPFFLLTFNIAALYFFSPSKVEFESTFENKKFLGSFAWKGYPKALISV